MHELFSKPGTWTQHVSARDVNGISVPFDEARACCWCLQGAIRFCYPKIEDQWRLLFRFKAVPEFGGRPPYFWNDAPERTQEEVQALCKRLDI